MGLNVTVFSYMDRLDFGLQVDPDLVPDVWVIAEQISASLAALMEASGLGVPTTVDMPFAGTLTDQAAVGGAASTAESESRNGSKRPSRTASKGSGGSDTKSGSARKPRIKAPVQA
jgi:diacylglycerol O-acyltransferase / wax synthase